jgi:hypothetical protein
VSGLHGSAGVENTPLKFGHLQKVTSGDFGPKPKGPRPVGTTPIVARHEVPVEDHPSKEPPRRYDRARLIPDVFLVEMCAVFLKEG